MAVIVTGTFILPDGGVAADRVITIRRARRDVVQQSGQVLVPDDVVIETDVTGQVLFDLMPGNYVGFARTASGACRRCGARSWEGVRNGSGKA